VTRPRASAGGVREAAHEGCVSVGGLSFRVLSDDHRLTSPPYSRFAASAADDIAADVVVRAGWSDEPFAVIGEPVFDSGGTWQLLRSHGELVFVFHASGGELPYKIARFDSTFSTGHVLLSTGYFERRGFDAVYPLQFPLDELLMVHLLSQGRGMELHASALVDASGRAYVFAGQSGAGKSTMARLWIDRPAVTLLSDERVVVRTDGERIVVYGTPWHGDALAASARSGVLAAVFFLSHYSANVLTRTAAPLAAAKLLSCSFLPFHSAEGVDRTAAAAERVAHSVPCYDLGFVPDGSVVTLLAHLMNA
jgi:hypothetical protein